MSQAQEQQEERFEQFLGNLLRAGVVLSACVVLAGGVVYLARHGGERTIQQRVFKGEPTDLKQPSLIGRDALAGNSRALIQLGLLLLIATPVARVVFSAFGFARQRDSTYVLLTLLVLAVLLLSLFSGQGL
jgi:uncharacterized membrane protein